MNKLKYPNLFVVGAMRAGTTSLFDYLGQHPEIFKPVQKGAGYFNDPNSSKLKKILKVMYGNWKKEKYAISASHYLKNEKACKNIKKLSPDAKIIVSLREPKEALRSLYNYNLASGNTKKISFEEWKKENSESLKEYDYKKNVRLWRENFGGNVKIIKFESWIKNPIKTCQEIFKSLRINDKFEPKIKVLNKAESISPPKKIREITTIFPKWLRLLILKKFPKLKKIYQRIIYKKK